MRRKIVLVVVMLSTFLAGGCGFKVFEDVAVDPHPPTVTVLGVTPTTISPGETIEVTIAYADTGADIQTLNLLDLDGGDFWPLAPEAPPAEDPTDTTTEVVAPEYFPGTSGTAQRSIEVPGKQAGTHRIQVWAEDSHESRSEKVEFVITVVF